MKPKYHYVILVLFFIGLSTAQLSPGNVWVKVQGHFSSLGGSCEAGFPLNISLSGPVFGSQPGNYVGFHNLNFACEPDQKLFRVCDCGGPYHIWWDVLEDKGNFVNGYPNELIRQELIEVVQGEFNSNYVVPATQPSLSTGSLT